jgi:acyl dehydratase
MPFNAALVGRTTAGIRWEATPRRMLAFHAALAPDSARWLDDAAEDFAAMPMIVVSPEWALAVAGRHDPDQTLSQAELNRGVHAEQDSRFFEVIRPGDVLTVTARLASAWASRAGAVATTVFQAYRESDGRLVAESRSVGVYRGVDVTGGPAAPERTAEPALDWTPTGDAPIALARGFAHLYSEAAEIWNPNHTERRVALAAGLPDIIVHGTALWALGAVHLPGADVAKLRRLQARFIAPVVAAEAVRLEEAASSGPGERPWRLVRPGGRVAVQGLAEFA